MLVYQISFPYEFLSNNIRPPGRGHFRPHSPSPYGPTYFLVRTAPVLTHNSILKLYSRINKHCKTMSYPSFMSRVILWGFFIVAMVFLRVLLPAKFTITTLSSTSSVIYKFLEVESKATLERPLTADAI